MLKDLQMNTNEKPPATYASIAQVTIFLYPWYITGFKAYIFYQKLQMSML